MIIILENFQMPGVWAQDAGGEWGAGTRQEFRTCQLLRDFLARTCPKCPVTKPGESYRFMRWHFRVETDSFFFAFARILFFLFHCREQFSYDVFKVIFLTKQKKLMLCQMFIWIFLIRSRQKVTLSCVYASRVEIESFTSLLRDFFLF